MNIGAPELIIILAILTVGVAIPVAVVLAFTLGRRRRDGTSTDVDGPAP